MQLEEKDEWRQRFLDVLAGFRLLDDNFMTVVFQNDLDCVNLTLQIILDNPNLRATKVITQDTIKNLQGHSVRLDIHAFADGQEFNIEIQRAEKGATERRARYNSSILDANTLLAGEDYEQLPESYVIFVTETDILGQGKPIYLIRRTIAGNNEIFHDGSHIIYVNSSMTEEDTSLGKLMHDFRCTRPEDMYYDVLARRVGYFKQEQEGVATMCKAMEDLVAQIREQSIAQGIEQGIEQGRAQGRAQGKEAERVFSIRALMANMEWSAEKAMDALAVPKAEQGRYKALL